MSACDCEHARTHLEELIRGELTATDCGPIREHLAQCPDCRDEQQVFEKLTVAVRRSCAEEAPPTLRDAILSGLSALQTGSAPAAAEHHIVPAQQPTPSACGCGPSCRCGEDV